jgi:magnesium chelatase family protein
MNPCPCGNRGTEDKECKCKETEIQRYERRISGPIMDRFDMWVEVSKINYDKLSTTNKTTDHVSHKKSVEKCRVMQNKRSERHNLKGSLNKDLPSKDLIKIIQINKEGLALLNENSRRIKLSARGYHKVLKLGRTIADLKEKEFVGTEEILEALQYRIKLPY